VVDVALNQICLCVALVFPTITTISSQFCICQRPLSCALHRTQQQSQRPRSSSLTQHLGDFRKRSYFLMGRREKVAKICLEDQFPTGLTPEILVSVQIGTIDHCRSRCKGQEGPPLIHSFIHLSKFEQEF
jgi:hypothetical protein